MNALERLGRYQVEWEVETKRNTKAFREMRKTG